MKKPFLASLVVVCTLGVVLSVEGQSSYTPYSFTTFAGNPPGSTNGTGTDARFDGPFGVAIGIDGNVYLADSNNNTIRKVTAPGGVVSTLAGLAGNGGSVDGTGDTARFFNPKGVGVDSVGNVYVADSSNHTIRKITTAGVVTTFAGLAGIPGSADGTGSLARFNFPTGVAVGGAGNLFVADNANNTIRKITPEGVVTTLAGKAGEKGSVNGKGDVARFRSPVGVAVDSAGTVYVADTANDTIRKITSDGTVSTLAGTARVTGSLDAVGTAARFAAPCGVAVDGRNGDVYVADTFNSTIRKIDSDANVTTLAGSPGMIGSVNGLGAAARFNRPRGLTVGAGGFVYVADTENNTMRQIDLDGNVGSLAGLAGTGSDNGAGSDARFTHPSGVALDTSGNLYVADNFNHTIRKITTDGMVSTLAGLAGVPGSANGAGSEARFNFPAGVAVDAAGYVYVADKANDTIRKITPDGVVSTLAGLAGVSGSTNDPPRFNMPTGVAVGVLGDVFVTDTGNNTIRQITPEGVVSTLAGSAGEVGSDNGLGALARFSGPAGITINSSDILYVADSLNNTIRKITPIGGVTTLAGSPGNPGGADGMGDTARFYHPKGVAAGADGSIYVGDELNDTIRIITRQGTVKTLGGSFGRPGGADGTGSVARFHFPTGVAVDSAAKLYVADHTNNVIRVGVPAPPVITSPLTADGVVGQQFVYQVGVFGDSVNQDGERAITVTGLPASLTYDSTLVAIVGSPSSIGTFPIAIDATNPIGTTTAMVTLTVKSAPASGLLERTGATGAIGQPFTYQVRASGVSSSVTVKATGLPTGLLCDPVTGVISGVLPDKLVVDEDSGLVVATPSQDGSSLVKLTTTGGNNTSTTTTVQLAFSSDPKLPVIVSPSVTTIMPGQAYSYKIATQSTADPSTYTKEGTLPLGLKFDAATGTISGTFKALSSGPSPQLSETPPTSVALFANNSHGPGTIPLSFGEGFSAPTNISTRLAVGVGEDVLIGGSYLTGNAPKKLLIRAIGPSLSASAGLKGVLADPTLELHDSKGAVIATNDNWKDTQEAEISDTTIPPTDDRESAILKVLPANNTGYTAIVGGKDDSVGVALVEIYDLGTASLDVSSQAQMANISTRGKVQTGDNVLIGGFMIPQGSIPDVLVRAIGPSLLNQVPGALLDTYLEVHDSNGDILESNNDWESDQKTEIMATGAPPKDPHESAIVLSLNPGAYTAIVRGKDDTFTGVALVEAYVLQ